ncbi:hypothetical protein BJ546DRAFT_948164 [Cryomyces antarcticus]
MPRSRSVSLQEQAATILSSSFCSALSLAIACQPISGGQYQIPEPTRRTATSVTAKTLLIATMMRDHTDEDTSRDAMGEETGTLDNAEDEAQHSCLRNGSMEEGQRRGVRAKQYSGSARCRQVSGRTYQTLLHEGHVRTYAEGTHKVGDSVACTRCAKRERPGGLKGIVEPTNGAPADVCAVGSFW